MKAITPPKETPRLQSAAASGMLPTEQTKETTASRGAMIAFSTEVIQPWPERKMCDHHDEGTSTARYPAMRKPARSSLRSIVMSPSV